MCCYVWGYVLYIPRWAMYHRFVVFLCSLGLLVLNIILWTSTSSLHRIEYIGFTCIKIWNYLNNHIYIIIYILYIPIGSMYGIYAHIGGILMVSVTIYSIHGYYGIVWPALQFMFLVARVRSKKFAAGPNQQGDYVFHLHFIPRNSAYNHKSFTTMKWIL